MTAMPPSPLQMVLLSSKGTPPAQLGSKLVAQGQPLLMPGQQSSQVMVNKQVPNLQMVTLVSKGGTPVTLADQTGAPFPTTGTGALVFADGPVLNDAEFTGSFSIESVLTNPGNAVVPAIAFQTDPDTGIYSGGDGIWSVSSNGTGMFDVTPTGIVVHGDITYSGHQNGAYHDPLTSQGDLYWYGPLGSARLPLGPAGTVLASNGSTLQYVVPPSGIVIGSTSIGAGTNGRVLFDNSGVAGEYAISGTGSVAMTNSPAFTGTPTAPLAALSANDNTVITAAWVKGQGYSTGGGTLTGITAGTGITVTGGAPSPTVNVDPAYLNANYLPLTGGVLTGQLSFGDLTAGSPALVKDAGGGLAVIKADGSNYATLTAATLATQSSIFFGNFGSIVTPGVDGVLTMFNNGGTSGVRYDFATPGMLKLRNHNNTADEAITFATAAPGTNNTTGATTAFVAAAITAGAFLTGITAGTGITITGATPSPTVNIANTAVAPGTYGDATHVGQFTVDAQGRITAASNVALSGGGTSISVGVTPPASPTDNSLWWFSDASSGGGQLYLRYNDGTGASQWVPAAAAATGPTGVLQTVVNTLVGGTYTGTYSTTSGAAPSTAGGALLSTASLTPQLSTSRIEFDISVKGIAYSANQVVMLALFDGTTLIDCAPYLVTNGTAVSETLVFRTSYASPGAGGPRTYTLRIGTNSGQSFGVNQVNNGSTTPPQNGQTSWFTITERAPS